MKNPLSKLVEILQDGITMVCGEIPGGSLPEGLTKVRERHRRKLLEDVLDARDEDLSEDQAAHARIMIRNDPTFLDELALVLSRVLDEVHWQIKGRLVGKLIAAVLSKAITREDFQFSADLALRASAISLDALRHVTRIEDGRVWYTSRRTEDNSILIHAGMGTTAQAGGVHLTRIGEILWRYVDHV